ncbi:glycosyltransferase family A protein [Rothia sp. HMSC072E10]|uniref:glycosyltransferase family 2 protein n=1 Tax=Rothia sp. HMSC072E10 TaxID=1739448 RepID=UPI0008A1AF87|nr:glycosyltransferase family A protein [Rothia sp. HMSC072E10]OFQ32743.1 glycosyl transferase [Rothia sp. HMSC072E10]
MPSPTVAVLVRTKDRPRFLRRALANIAEQTFTDYTVCVINDGGDEPATRAILQASPLAHLLEGDAPRLMLLTTGGGNMEAASNAGLAATDSEFVAIHDDDDLWAPEFLERTVGALRASDALICSTRVVERYERETPEGEFEVYEERIFHDGLPGFGLQFLYRTNRAVPIGILYRRRLHELVGFYDESLPVVGDWEFNLRAAAVTEVLLVDEPLAYWSLRPEADGAEANSVQRQAEHARFDASVRARAIRDDLQSGGRPGPYLYQAHLMADLERRVIDGHDLTRESLDLLRSLGKRLERIEARQAAMDARQRELEARFAADRSRGRGTLRTLSSAARSLARRMRSATPHGEGR